jgi:hypothetical protein
LRKLPRIFSLSPPTLHSPARWLLQPTPKEQDDPEGHEAKDSYQSVDFGQGLRIVALVALSMAFAG